MEIENKKKSSKLTLVVLIILAVVLYVAHIIRYTQYDYTSKSEELVLNGILDMYSKISLPEQISENLWLNSIDAEGKVLKFSYQITEEMDEEEVITFKMLVKQDAINNLNDNADAVSYMKIGYVYSYEFFGIDSTLLCSFTINYDDLVVNKNIYYL